MDLKGVLYNGAAVAWMGVVVGAWIAIDQGFTEPWLSFSSVPGGPVGGMAAVIVLTVAGWLVIGKFHQRHERARWEEVGRQAGFRPDGDGRDADGPELSGTVDGRPVSAWYEKRKRGGGGESSGRSVTFTLGETALSGPADEGVLVGSAGGRVRVDDGVGILDFGEMAETVAALDGLVAVESGDLVFVGTSTASVDAVADGLSGDALAAINDLKIASVGDASGVVARWAEARNEEFEESILEVPVDNLVERVPGDAATVTVETRTSIRDGEVLRRFAEGVVVIADGFQEETARTPTAG